MTRIHTSVGAAAALLVAAGLPLVATVPAVAASATVPWDFNGDGRADLAVGAPGEDVGKLDDAGSVSIFLADSSGAYSSSTVWTQNSPDVPGGAEAGDQFGFAVTSGDYDSDGYADLAVAANRETVGSGNTAGMVTVLWGSPSGITGAGSKVLVFSASGTEADGAFAGDAMASGDFNNDGADDLAVGAPGIEQVRIYTGTPSNKASFGSTGMLFSEASPGVQGKKHVGTASKAGDLFGESMVVGDFNDDNFDDLAVGAPYDYDDTGYAVGAVVVFPGQNSTSAPVNLEESTRWSPDTKGVKGVSHTFTVNDSPDSFGRTLAAGDFNADGVDDLAVGIPGVPTTRTSGGKKYQDAGVVQIFDGAAGVGVTATDAILSQETAGIGGKSEAGDLFGASLDAGNGPGATDVLAIGSGEELVRVLTGGTGAGSLTLSQNSAGIWGGTENGDAFGAFVRFIANAGGGNESLAVGSPGEDEGAGAVFVLPSNGTLPSGVNSQKFDEDDPDVGGVKESGDAWGWLGDSH